MVKHTPALLTGSAAQHAQAHTDIQGEHCMPCWQDAADTAAPYPMPCLHTSGQPLTVGTLVQVLPAPRWHRVPARSAVVVLDTRSLAVVWFWTLGAPEDGATLFTVAAAEVVPMTTTLGTLPMPAFVRLDYAARAAYADRRELMRPLLRSLTAATLSA